MSQRNGSLSHEPREVIPFSGHGELVERAKSDISDVIRSSTMEISGVLERLNESIAKCEAELEVHEKINVIFEADKTIFSVERSFRLAKDKP